MIVAKWFLLILPIFPAITAWAENPPPVNVENRPAWQLLNGKQALADMAKAIRTLNYQGTVAFLRNGDLEPMKYSHVANKGREQEHLLSLNSPLREMVRETGNVSCLYKATQQLTVDHRPFERSFLVDMPTDINQLDAAYDIEMQGEESIAMLPAFVIALKPKDKLRYPRKIWLGQKSSLPLKVVVYDLSGAVLEELMFTELEVKDTLPFIEMKPPTNNAVLAQGNSPDLSQQASFVMDATPLGFKEVYFSRKPMRDSVQPVDHLLLSDGLASVSIYMEHKNSDGVTIASDTKGVQTIDAVNFFSHSLAEFQLTVMGEVPAETIQIIADSIKLRDTAH